MGEEGESSSSRQVYPPEVAYAPATPAKPDRSDWGPIGIDWLKNQFDEVIFEETSAKKSISCWEGNSVSTSHIYDLSGFSMDDVETWNSISCRDLLALADATIRRGSDDGDHDRSDGLDFDNRSNCIDTQQYGWLNLGNYSPDLNLPPEMVMKPLVSTGLSTQITPGTPDQARRAEHKQMGSDIVAKVVADNNKERYNLDEQPQVQVLVEQLQGDVSTIVEANQDFEKGLTAETNLNETPQPKQRRRKHRPKVVREGQQKKAKQSATPQKPDGSSTGKRKYVRKKGVEKSPATPAVEEGSGTIDPSSDQQNKKSCRKKINFDETEKGNEVTVETAEVNITVDKTCSMNQVVETILESQSASPITPSKTELPIKDAKHTYRKVKCRINFLQETHDKRPSSVSSPNESNCSTSASFNKGEAQGSKMELSSKIVGMELWDENAIGVGCNLSKFTNDCSGGKQGMHLPANKKKRIEKCRSSITSGAISSVCSAQSSDCSFLAEQNASKAPQMSKDYVLKDDQQPYKQAFGHLENSKKKRRSKALSLIPDLALFPGIVEGRHWQTPKEGSRYEVAYQQQTYTEAHAADFHVSIATKKRMKKNAKLPSLYQDHLRFTKGCIDSLINQFERLDINSQMAEEGRDALIPYLSRYNEKNALVLYQERGLVPFEGLFNPVKRRKPRPKVDLDEETSRVWTLLLENINSQGIDGTDEDKAKWWEEERRVFRGRADSFIARMHLVQGDRRFSRWKGSVLDSVIGVFLTQNVSDHLSSSAFMALAARYPLKSKSSSEPLHDDESILSVKEPCQVDQDETITWHEKLNQPSGDHGPMMLQDIDLCEEKEVVNSNKFPKNSGCVDLNVSSEGEVPELAEKDLAMYKESVVDQIENDDIASSQNSANMSPSSVQSSVAHTTERLGSCSKEEQKDMSKATIFGGYTSFVELLHMQGTTTVHETYSQQQAEESSNKKIGQDELESVAYLEEQNDGISPHSNSSRALEVETFELREERNITQKKSQEEFASEESGLSAESASQAMVQLVKTTSSQEASKSCNTCHIRLQERSRSRCKMIAVNPNINTEQHTEDNNCEVQEVIAIANVSADNSKATESNNILKASGETAHKVVEINSVDHGTHQIVNGMDEGSSKVKRQKSGKVKQKIEWDNLRLHAEVTEKRERTPNTSDSLDYEAVRTADVNEVADTIKERGMNNVLAARIKDLLDRLVEDHGSIDLEWLRDVPPDKAKEYLLSFRGLGLKSVECVRLLTLHHLAFPVDTNVGRIAVRLGWVPLQPLPESLQLHLLELYPVLESIQKYLWPRLCKLDQRTLYELHYQMITFGKVFCTKSKPNCNACPMRGECRHFASAFASARLGLPAPEERMASLTENRTGQSSIGLIEQCHITLPSASEQWQQLSDIQNCNSGIEEPATPGSTVEVPATSGPIVEVPATSGTIVEVPATSGPIVEVPATPGPIVEVPETPGPIIEVPATPEPEPIQEEFDIEDFCEDSEEIPMIKLNIEEFTQNLQTYMEKHMVLGEGDMSKALVALTSEAASIPTPKLKNVSQLRTEHQVYELPDSHPLLEGLDTREPDDPCSYLLAIWTPGETADSIQPPEGQCCSQESGTLCSEETCFFCNSTREANSQTVRGTLLIPCRTAMRGSFPLNGTYFQVNEVFADHESSLNPIDVPRSWLWNLPRRTVYFGTSIPTIFKGLTTEDIQYCFWRGFVCVRGFDQKTRAPRPLMARLHFPASKLKRSRPKTDGN
ncbi:protein ROS1-like isoform X1 [Cynara cardunculus var. scolymus]|uniref:protein ROS1-like isoform X1 n=2 Tax=Cynara cardunculus var. scolymus TaxID=59895 RepID=UPI000D6236E3|nr:protein ROS1-like isoform X1 [Cynara cardunculus var. scolymus]